MNSSSCSRPATSSGFTLIELMVTIAVLAIIMSIAAPNISSQLANQRVKSTTATLSNALKEARTESVIRRQPLVLSYDNNSDDSGIIEIKTAATINTYSYDAKSIIKPPQATITFEPSKHVDAAVTYTICDSNTAAAPRQISVSKLGNISTQLRGNCP